MLLFFCSCFQNILQVYMYPAQLYTRTDRATVSLSEHKAIDWLQSEIKKFCKSIAKK